MRVDADGVEIDYEVDGEGEPIVFLHGFPLSGRLWDPAVQDLRGEFRCIVPDLRGHGRSETSARVDMARYADDVAALLDSLGETRPAVVVGHSMGGYVAFEFFRRHPQRVRAVVLVDTRAVPDSPEAARVRRETAASVLREGSALVAGEMERRLFGISASPELRARWREIMASTPPAGVAAALRAMADRPDSMSTLAALDRPVLIVVGAEDSITPLGEAQRMYRAHPSATLEVISGAGHMTPVERPTAFVAALRRFLSRL